jgi:hypothetical protein
VSQSARSGDDDVRVHLQVGELLLHVLSSDKCAVSEIGLLPDFLRELERLKSEFAGEKHYIQKKWYQKRKDKIIIKTK